MFREGEPGEGGQLQADGIGTAGEFSRWENPMARKGVIAAPVRPELTGMTILLIKDSSVLMQKMSGYLSLTCSVIFCLREFLCRICGNLSRMLWGSP